MVLKNLVRYIINKYLKDYIEELDYEKLKLDLRNGHVCLEKLHLKPEALVDLSLPVTVAVGYIENLTLIIPWKNLYHHPTKVSIDGLYMLVVPKNEVRRDFTGYYDDKMRRVQRKVDNLRKAGLNNKKLDEKETTFLERMRLQIMQNLHISIDNLHISYETISTTKLGHPFCFGLTIDYLEMITTTDHRFMRRNKENSTVIFKMKEMRALSLYWNTQCRSRIDMSFDDVVKDLKSKIATNSYIPTDLEMNYILYPVNPVIDLTIILQPGEFNFERPTYDLDIQIERLDLNIDPKQFSDLLDFIKFQNYSKLYDRCREYRELQMHQIIDKQPLSSEQKIRLQYLETKLDVFNLAYIRYLVELESNPNLPIKHHSHHHRLIYRHHHHHHHNHHHPRATRMTTASVSPTSHPKWWNSWWKTKSHVNEERRRSSASESISNNDDLSSEDSPNIDVKVKVRHLTLNLSYPQRDNRVTLTDKDILCPIEINNTQIDFKRQAVSSNILFIIDLQSLSLFGMQGVGNQRPLLVTAISKSSLPLIHSELELSPMDKKSDYRLHLVIEPLRITYDAPTINHIVQCFETNVDDVWSAVAQIKERTIEEMEQDLLHEKIFDMTLHLQGISLVLPGYDANSSSRINIDFGSLILQSCLDDQHDDFVTQDSIQRYYAKYNLKLHDLQIVYSSSNKQQTRLLRRLPILDTDFYKCVCPNDAKLLDWRIVVNITRMNTIELSPITLTELIQHLKSVPLLYSNLIETLHRVNLYFTIFPPHTTIDVKFMVQKCSLLLTNFYTSISTDIDGHILKTRKKKDMKLLLNNLVMLHRNQSLIPCLIYRKQSIELIYKKDLADHL
ncbi:unnamed protein product [Adineta ricciae]|uniref:Chorein N-terminal domain-containing protein n=1 Tax=Adineta ricciae TaxID=249248 RepID=A0A815PGG9_ADIRI|nr:unnamed protein product [Adineta ricciae]